MSATAAFLVSNQVSGDSRSGSGLKVPCGVSETAGQAEARRSSHVYVLHPPAHKPKNIYIYPPRLLHPRLINSLSVTISSSRLSPLCLRLRPCQDAISRLH